MADPDPFNLEMRHASVQCLIERLRDRLDLIRTIEDALAGAVDLGHIPDETAEEDGVLAQVLDTLGDSGFVLHAQMVTLQQTARMLRAAGRRQGNVASVSRAVRVFQSMTAPR